MWLFGVTNYRSLRGHTFCVNRKYAKNHTGRGCFDSPSPCEPSPATTEVGSRSPFWNPLRVVQCLTLLAAIFAKTNLAQKTAALHLRTHSGRTACPLCRLFTSDNCGAKKLSKLFYCQIKKTKCKRRTKKRNKNSRKCSKFVPCFFVQICYFRSKAGGKTI